MVFNPYTEIVTAPNHPFIFIAEWEFEPKPNYFTSLTFHTSTLTNYILRHKIFKRIGWYGAYPKYVTVSTIETLKSWRHPYVQAPMISSQKILYRSCSAGDFMFVKLLRNGISWWCSLTSTEGSRGWNDLCIHFSFHPYAPVFFLRAVKKAL